jgi:hypothetical protein
MASPESRALQNFLDEHSIVHRDFAAGIEIDPRTVRRWLNGETPVPGSVRIMLDLFDRFERVGAPIWHNYFKPEPSDEKGRRA